MHKRFFKQNGNKNFITAFAIACILMTAGILKWVYPTGRDALFFSTIGVAECLLGLILITTFKSWRIWMLLSTVIATLMGFSFYTALFGLPCPCMGSALELPRGVTFVLNGTMLYGAWGVLKRYPLEVVLFKRFFLSLFFLFIIGFVSAFIYYNYQT